LDWMGKGEREGKGKSISMSHGARMVAGCTARSVLLMPVAGQQLPVSVACVKLGHS